LRHYEGPVAWAVAGISARSSTLLRRTADRQAAAAPLRARRPDEFRQAGWEPFLSQVA
jgi:hypothetical protein